MIQYLRNLITIRVRFAGRRLEVLAFGAQLTTCVHNGNFQFKANLLFLGSGFDLDISRDKDMPIDIIGMVALLTLPLVVGIQIGAEPEPEEDFLTSILNNMRADEERLRRQAGVYRRPTLTEENSVGIYTPVDDDDTEHRSW